MDRKKLLAINFGGIGDEILFLPTLSTFKEHYPDWHISLLVEPRSKSIEQVTNLIDEVLIFNIKKKPLLISDLLDLVGQLRDGGFDLVISSGSSPFVALLLFLSGIKQRIGYASNWLAKILLTNAVPLVRNQYAAHMYHDLVSKGLGIVAEPQLPQITVREKSRVGMSSFLQQQQPNHATRILIHPGVSQLSLQNNIIKTWESQNWSWLIQELIEQGFQIILAGGPDDEVTIKEILAQLSSTSLKNLILAFGHTANLSDLAALIELSNLVVCVDSAPMHIAVGLHKPLVALFGPTQEQKLLPKNNYFCAVRGESLKQTDLWAMTGVTIAVTPDLVYAKALDQLQVASNPKNSPACSH